MALQHAVLALLGEGPSYGWDLKASFEDAVGPQWGLNVGHLYQVLDRLRRDGLATAEVVSSPDHPDRTVYRITDRGQAELEGWLGSTAGRTRGYRDDFFLKLTAAARRDPATLACVIRSQRQRYLQELRSLSELRASAAHDVITEMILAAATLHTEADLRVVDLAEERSRRLHEHVAGGQVSGHQPREVSSPSTSGLVGEHPVPEDVAHG